MEIDQQQQPCSSVNNRTATSTSNATRTLSLPQIDENNTLDDKKPKERLIEMLDLLESHVERLRKEGAQLEEEKDSVLASLDSLRHTDTLKDLDEFDKDDILRYVEQVTNRCHTIDVHIRIQRDQTQEEALHQINHFIDGLVVGMKADPDGTKARCLSYMNACSSNFVHGITDKNFESALLGCTLDDQKRVKKRLHGLLSYFDRIEREAAFN